MLPRLEIKFKSIEKRLKRIEDELEFSPVVITFDWENFSEQDKTILNYLLSKGKEGDTTTSIAKKIGLINPEKSGRVIIYRRLKRIARLSLKREGLSLVIYEKKRWSLNYDVFNFPKSLRG